MATAFAQIAKSGAETKEEPTVTESSTAGTGAIGAGEPTAPAPAWKMPPQLVKFTKGMMAPMLGILAFLGVWAALAPQVDTSLGALPGPVEVAEQGVSLFGEWQASQDAKAEFYAAQDARIDAIVRRKITSLSRQVPPGSREWDVLYQKYYAEESRKQKS